MSIGVTELVKSISIENIINQRAQVGALVRQAHELLQQASVLAEAAHMDTIAGALSPRYHGDNISRLIRTLLRKAWEQPELAEAA